LPADRAVLTTPDDPHAATTEFAEQRISLRHHPRPVGSFRGDRTGTDLRIVVLGHQPSSPRVSDRRVSPQAHRHRVVATVLAHPATVSPISTRLSATTTTTISQLRTVVARWFASAPINVRSPVKRTNGISANGIPNDSTTCDRTRAQLGSTPSAMMSSAGTRVTNLRSNNGTRRRNNPCMIMLPA